MKKTVKGSYVTKDGTNGNDQFTVKGSHNTVNAKGGEKDTIKITSGDYHAINGGNGVDIITVKKGNYQTIHGDKGNDIIKISNKGWDGNKWHNYESGSWTPRDLVYGDAGNDEIYVYAGRHAIYGGSGNDIITIYKNAEDKNEIYSGSGNDTITISGGNYHEIFAGSSTKKKKDVIKINKGNGITVHGEDGVDDIKVTGGRDHTLYGDAGNDIISVKGADNVRMYGGAGKDEITINGGNNHTIETGDAKDIVTINKGSNHTINNTTGNGGNDAIIINKNAGSNIKVYGHDSAAETVKVYGGDGHEISLRNGNNKITIAAGQNHYVYTGNNADTIIIDNAHVSYLATGAGDDTITIRNGAYVSKAINSYNDEKPIETGDGDDKVYIEANAGNDTCMHTANGDDEIYVRGGKNHQIYPGPGNDTISVTGGSGHGIHLGAESGRNTVTLSAKDVYLQTNWNAADKIAINWGNDMGDYTIVAFGTPSAAIKDTLTINNIKIDDFSFTVLGKANSLVLSSDSGTITVNNWYYEANEGFDGITFADGYLTYEQINQKAGYNG